MIASTPGASPTVSYATVRISGVDGMTQDGWVESSGAPACVRVEYGDRVISAARGQRLLDAILDADIDHRHVCGGRGFCTSCRVEVLDAGTGLSVPSALEHERLGRDAGRLRLACQAVVAGDVSVRVPKPISAGFGPDGE